RSTDTPTVSGASPTVIVRVDADVLETHTGTGEIVGIPDPIPSSAIKQLLCDSSTIPVYLKPDGGIAAIGTEKRTFNRTQRAGMIARDGPTCALPNCHIPATACEAHHIEEYHNGGPTHVDNGILLCWFHHHMVDTNIFTITMSNGTPTITAPDWLTHRPYFH
ncbi:HNH endonuclease, partial [Mycetocola manganoxydans]